MFDDVFFRYIDARYITPLLTTVPLTFIAPSGSRGAFLKHRHKRIRPPSATDHYNYYTGVLFILLLYEMPYLITRRRGATQQNGRIKCVPVRRKGSPCTYRRSGRRLGYETKTHGTRKKAFGERQYDIRIHYNILCL